MPEESKIDQRLRRLQDRMLKPEPPIPMAKPGERVGRLPSPSGYLLLGAKELAKRPGDLLSIAAGTLIPEPAVLGRAFTTLAPLAKRAPGLLGFASRLVGAETGQEAGDVLGRQTVTPGKGAASWALGEAAGKLGSYLLSPLRASAYAKRVGKQAMEWLQNNVDAWIGLEATEKGLYEAAHKTGPRLLRNRFSHGLSELKATIPDTAVVRVEGEPIDIKGRALRPEPEVRNARALIDELPDLRKAGGRPYQRALDALARDLPEGASPELTELRRQYAVGSGWIELAERGGFLHGERLDPVKLQGALDRFGRRTLFNRGLDPLANILRGSGSEPIRAQPFHPIGRYGAGAIGGEMAAEVLGMPRGTGVVPGAAVGHFLPSHFYSNVPMSTAEKYATRVLPQLTVGEAARELARRSGY